MKNLNPLRNKRDELSLSYFLLRLPHTINITSMQAVRSEINPHTIFRKLYLAAR